MLPVLDLGQNVKIMGRASVKFYKGSSSVGKQLAERKRLDNKSKGVENKQGKFTSSNIRKEKDNKIKTVKKS